MIFNELGQSIKNARKAQGLTQTQVSEAVAVSRKTLSSLETGKISDIGVRKLLALCAVLDLNFHQCLRVRLTDSLAGGFNPWGRFFG